MEGVVDPVLRGLFSELGGVDLMVTEFIRVTDRELPDHVFLRDAPELSTGSQTASGTPVVVQLLGGQPDVVAVNARRATQLGSPGLDLNFGCPAKTVNRHDGGAALLREPARIEKIVRATRAAVAAHLPVSAKIRLGFHDTSACLDIAQAAAAGGASWITVHGRTRDEGYRPVVHWDLIARIAEALKIPVIANGEVWSPADAADIRRVTGCRHIMVGRGWVARPFLGHEIRSGRAPAGLTELWPWLLRFFHRSEAARGSAFAVARCKQWVRSLSRNSPECAVLFERIKIASTSAEMLAGLQSARPQEA
jgi:tRNA-dihydrouridine synthase C